MYYQNYDDYMRDVFYYNQIPNQNMAFNNITMGYTVPNPNMNNQYNINQKLESLYPDIYRIIQPVVSRVVTGNNYQFVNEENLNSMVETIFNIIDGDNNIDDSKNNNVSSNNTQRTNNQNNSQMNSSMKNSTNQDTSNLLKDLIKILVIKEIINRNNIRRFNNNMMMGYQNFPNYYEQRYGF